MGKRSRPPKRSRPATQRHYKRTARLNPLIQRIVAEYFEEIEDERLGLLTVTGVEVDADLNKAQVYVSNLDGDLVGSTEFDEDRDRDILEALEDHRREVRLVIARSARLRKTPDVLFGFDPAVRSGAKIDKLLSKIEPAGLPKTDVVSDDFSDDAFAGSTFLNSTTGAVDLPEMRAEEE